MGAYENPQYTPIDPSVGLRAFQESFWQTYKFFDAEKKRKRKEKEEYNKRNDDIVHGIHGGVKGVEKYSQENQNLSTAAVNEVATMLNDGRTFSAHEQNQLAQAYQGAHSVISNIYRHSVEGVTYIDESNPLSDDYRAIMNAVTNGTLKTPVTLDRDNLQFNQEIHIGEGENKRTFSGNEGGAMLSFIEGNQNNQKNKSDNYEKSLTNTVTEVNSILDNNKTLGIYGPDSRTTAVDNEIVLRFQLNNEENLNWLYHNEVTPEYKDKQWDMFIGSAFPESSEGAYVEKLNDLDIISMSNEEITTIVDSVKGDIPLTEEEKGFIEKIKNYKSTFKFNTTKSYISDELVGVNAAPVRPIPDTQSFNEIYGTGSTSLYYLENDILNFFHDINLRTGAMVHAAEGHTGASSVNIHSKRERDNLITSYVAQRTGLNIVPVGHRYTEYKANIINNNNAIDYAMFDNPTEMFENVPWLQFNEEAYNTAAAKWPSKVEDGEVVFNTLNEKQKREIAQQPILNESKWKDTLDSPDGTIFYIHKNGSYITINDNLRTARGVYDFVKRNKNIGKESRYRWGQEIKNNELLSNTGVTTSDVTHTMKKGETLWSMSKKYGIPMADIQKANPNLNWDDVPIGHDITIPGGIAGVNDKVNEYL